MQQPISVGNLSVRYLVLVGVLITRAVWFLLTQDTREHTETCSPSVRGHW
jgi:hypothetical protein